MSTQTEIIKILCEELELLADYIGKMTLENDIATRNNIACEALKSMVGAITTARVTNKEVI